MTVMMGEDASGKNRDPKPVRLGNNHIIVLENPGDDKVSSHLVEYLDDQNIVVPQQNIHRVESEAAVAGEIFGLTHDADSKRIKNLGVLDMRGSLEAVQSFLSTQIKNIQNALAASGATVNRFFFGTNAEGIENTALRCTGIDNLEKFELETDGPELARQLAQAEATEATTSHKSTIYRPHLTSPDQYAMFVRKAFTKKQTA